MTELKFPVAINQDGYTYEFQSLYSSKYQSRIQFNWMKQQGKLCEDSKFRTLRKVINGDVFYGLYIWY